MREQTVTIDGHPYTLTTLNARLAQEYLDFAKKTMPDPVAEVVEAVKALPDGPTKDKFLERELEAAFARKRLRGTPTDPDLEDFSRSEPGMKKFFSLLFRKHHPGLTQDQVYDVVLKGIEEHGDQLFRDVAEAGSKSPMTERQVEDAFSGPSA